MAHGHGGYRAGAGSGGRRVGAGRPFGSGDRKRGEIFATAATLGCSEYQAACLLMAKARARYKAAGPHDGERPLRDLLGYVRRAMRIGLETGEGEQPLPPRQCELLVKGDPEGGMIATAWRFADEPDSPWVPV